ncbi:MAG TPA: hypothetical protein VIF10_06995 [Methylobacter sp.]|jgi:hypothetical protein
MKKRIALISCVKTKLPYRAKARDLYISPLFKLNLKYAKKLAPDEIFILSAEHGLLSLEDEIEPYEKTLNKMRSSEVQIWANNVHQQLKEVCSLDESEFIFLAGVKYRNHLLPYMINYEIPLKDLQFGKQLQKLKELVL